MKVKLATSDAPTSTSVSKRFDSAGSPVGRLKQLLTHPRWSGQTWQYYP